jgi:hypothetical protein
MHEQSFFLMLTKTLLTTTLLSLMIVAYSCNRSVPVAELICSWETIYNYGSSNPSYYQLNFSQNQVIVTGEFHHPQRANYTYREREIIISHKDWPLGISLTIDYLTGDTLYLDDGTKLVRMNREFNQTVYDLPSVRGGISLPVQERSITLQTFQYYHTGGDNTPTLHFNSHTITPEDVPLALVAHHSKGVVLLFADRSITVAELHGFYLLLAKSGVRKLYIVSGQQGFDTFTCMKDQPHVWYEELENLTPSIPLPPPPLVTSREEWLSLPNSRQVRISAVSDTSIISVLDTNLEYLFTIDSKLSLQEYLKIKQCLSSWRVKNDLRFILELDKKTVGLLPMREG